MSWLDEKHPDYERQIELWNFTRAHYDDRYIYWDLERDESEREEPHGSRFLPKKSQSEHQLEYRERKLLAAYPNYVGPVLDSFAGLLFHREGEADRSWGGLGDPETEDSLAATLTRDADRAGTDHESQLKQLAVDLMQYQKIGVLVDTNRMDDGDMTREEARRMGVRAAWKLVPPQSIVNWRTDDDGRLLEVLIKEERDERASLKQDASRAKAERFLHLELTPGADEGTGRWRRLRENSEAEGGVEEVEANTFEYVDRSGRPTLPFHVQRLPLRRYPAHTLARLANAIFNLENGSILWAIRKAGFQTFVFNGSKEQFNQFKSDRLQGANVVRESTNPEEGGGGHRYIGPDMAGPQSATEVRERLIKQFWAVAQYEFSDQAAERTATEISADFVASMGAFLNILAGAVDEAENAALFLLEQAAGVDSPGEAQVQRSREFGVEDGLKMVERIATVFFGQQAGIPLPPEVEGGLGVAMLEQADLMERVAEAVDMSAEELADVVLRNAESEADRERIMREAALAAREQMEGGEEEEGEIEEEAA